MAKQATQVEIDNLIKSSIATINANFDTDEIILFGSYAKGTATALSDVDMAVISPEFKRKSIFANVKTLVTKTKLMEPYLQLVAFNSQDFFQENFINVDFIREIKRTGRVLYRKAGL